MNTSDYAYVGFWKRALAMIIDTVILMLLIAPLLTLFYGRSYWSSDSTEIHGFLDVFLTIILPIIATIMFWIYRQATPGKMIVGARIVDVSTGSPPSNGQLVGRYFGYIISTLPFVLGFIWIGIDKRKRGFHDKLSGTAVVEKSKIE